MNQENTLLVTAPERNGFQHEASTDASEHQSSGRGANPASDNNETITGAAPELVTEANPLITTQDPQHRAWKIGPYTYHAPVLMPEQAVEELITKTKGLNSDAQRKVERARVFYLLASGLKTEIIQMLMAMEQSWKEAEAQRRQRVEELTGQYDLSLAERKALLEQKVEKESRFRQLTAQVGIQCAPTLDALQNALYEAAGFDPKLYRLILEERRRFAVAAPPQNMPAVSEPVATAAPSAEAEERQAVPTQQGIPFLELVFGMCSGGMFAAGLGSMTHWAEPQDFFNPLHWTFPLLFLAAVGQAAVFGLGALVHGTALDHYRADEPPRRFRQFPLVAAWLAAGVCDAWGMYSARMVSALDNRPQTALPLFFALSLLLSGLYLGLKIQRARKEVELEKTVVQSQTSETAAVEMAEAGKAKVQDESEQARRSRFDELTGQVEALSAQQKAALKPLETMQELQEAVAVCTEAEMLQDRVQRHSAHIELMKADMLALQQEVCPDAEMLRAISDKNTAFEAARANVIASLHGIAVTPEAVQAA